MPRIVPPNEKARKKYVENEHTKRKNEKWNHHKFLCFDGEGCDINGKHQYVYLCAYNGEQHFDIRNDSGLSTVQCFDFLLEHSGSDRRFISVIYGGSYDSNMMLRDVSVVRLHELHHNGICWWRGYRIEYVSRKYLSISKSGKSVRLWDTIGFFQSTFEQSLDTWLNIVDETIAQGKANRSRFTINEIDNIIKYCKLELIYFEKLIQRVWKALNDIGLKIRRWDGAGAVASAFLSKYEVKKYAGTQQQNDAHYYEARCAYAGGRFELISPGDYNCKVYSYDINSAYPYAMTLLPEFTGLIKCERDDCIIGDYDLVKLHYKSHYEDEFNPFFHRNIDGSVYYPPEHIGWHWGIEYLTALVYSTSDIDVLSHYHWRDNGIRPFAWLPSLYEYRKELKEQKDQAQLMIKLGINSLYGKMAQQKGWRAGQPIPANHQLYWAGWVTAYCRTMIYRAMMQKPDCVIACETDGIYMTSPLDLDIGDDLGQWEQNIYDEFTYVQSGMYFGIKNDKEVAKYRGLGRDILTRDAILNAWSNNDEKFTVPVTRFRTLGTSLVGERINNWREWVTEDREINLYCSTGKRLHIEILCHCQGKWGRNSSHTTTCNIPNKIESEPYNVLWVNAEEKLEYYYMQEENMELWIIHD